MGSCGSRNRWLCSIGISDIGPETGLPVMEGKCLFKTFANVDAFPICLAIGY